MKISKIYKDATIPTRKNPSDAGLDIYAYIPETGKWSLYPKDIVIFRTGIAIQLPKGYFGWITNKSSKDYIIGGGIVDEGYRGELLVKICNTTSDTIIIKHNEAIAQLLIIPCIKPELETVSLEELSKADRGEDGGILRQLSEENLI